MHTGYQFDLARTGHEFYSLDIPGSGEVFWDSKSRPQPPNYHRLSFSEEPPVKFDLALAHFEMGYHCLKRLDLPLIWKEHGLRWPFVVPAEWVERTAFFSFASRMAEQAWQVAPEAAHRKRIIGMGMDLQTYGGYAGDGGGILVVGQNICSRGNEKGYDNLMRLARKFSICVVGMGNEGIPGAIGAAANYGELVRHYQRHEVFLNPSNILGMSTLEAMATGMPVVCFRMMNSDVIRNGVNGLIVDSVKEAAEALNCLLKNRALARELGRKARVTIREKFRVESFVRGWNALFQQAVDEHRCNCGQRKWAPFEIAAKPPEERRLAESVTVRAF
ncbi:MAG TPA: glycosyltransferase, partial [Verrucomicrobiae bacterium]|nr:glycosyltransferase [Verrucomicrobiae bacterium]